MKKSITAIDINEEKGQQTHTTDKRNAFEQTYFTIILRNAVKRMSRQRKINETDEKTTTMNMNSYV